MQHVDDGALHAYLDGALDSYPPGEAARVREHLDACPECARRLEGEREIRAEAEAILATSAPVVQMPPLEELRALADRRVEATHARGLSRLNRWGWAASVILALGTGWMLRGVIPGTISRPGLQEQAAEPSVAAPSAEGTVGAVVSDAAGETASPDAAAAAVLAEDDQGVSRQDFAAVPAASETDRDAPADPEPAEVEERVGERGAGEPAPATFADERVAQPAASPMVEARTGQVDSVRRREEAEARLAPARAEQAMVERRTSPSAEGVRFRSQEVQDRPGEPLPPAEAAEAAKSVVSDDEAGSLGVPGLALVDVSWVLDDRAESGLFAAAGGGRAVRVRQVREDGDTLEIIHMPAGSHPSALPGAPADGTTELVAQYGEGWIVLRADASPDTLEAYLRRLLGG